MVQTRQSSGYCKSTIGSDTIAGKTSLSSPPLFQYWSMSDLQLKNSHLSWNSLSFDFFGVGWQELEGTLGSELSAEDEEDISAELAALETDVRTFSSNLVKSHLVEMVLVLVLNPGHS